MNMIDMMEMEDFLNKVEKVMNDNYDNFNKDDFDMEIENNLITFFVPNNIYKNGTEVIVKEIDFTKYDINIDVKNLD